MAKSESTPPHSLTLSCTICHSICQSISHITQETNAHSSTSGKHGTATQSRHDMTTPQPSENSMTEFPAGSDPHQAVAGAGALADTAGGGQQEPEPSLQLAFQSFLRKKRQKNKAAHQHADVLSLPATDPQRMALVRQMFLERIRSYIGVPYARRYHSREDAVCECEGCREAGRQLGQSPVFLDCCGLIRKALRDMSEVLGFRIGPGNQAYQYDTLPGRVESHFQLEPGDLIFYSGVYTDPTRKQYAFNMTHVEVFVGGDTGEATIGSRWRYKWVQEFPSYAFHSPRWTLLKHHYVKVDSWLQGVCEPAHPELWRTRGSRAVAEAGGGTAVSVGPPQLGWDSRKHSIFFHNGDQGSSGEDADED